MARITLIFPLLLSVVWATVPDSITYVGPDTVVQLSQGSGQYQVGIKDGDTLKGPCRLIASDTRLYLLDQFNNRVLCYDTAGTFVFETKTRIQPVDMAVDGSDLIHLLDNHSNPALVVTYDGAKEVDRMEVKYDTSRRPHALNVHSEHGLLFKYKGRLFGKSPSFYFGGILGCQPAVERYRMDKEHTSLLEGWSTYTYGKGFSSTGSGREICSKDENTLPFLGNDTSIRVIVGVDYTVSSKDEGSTTTKNIHVRLNDIPTMLLRPVSEDYFLFNRDWRNVSVDDAGNIYIFASVPQGGASILKWRPSL